jgi:hypothetical protein
MPFSFPASPALNATSTQNGREYRYAGNNTWELVAASGGSGALSGSVTLPGIGDPDFISVSLLLHGNGEGSTFVDSSGTPKTITANGNATQSATQRKFGAKSVYLDGDGDYLSVPSSADFDFSGDFTIEAWVYWTANAAGQHNTIMARGNRETSSQWSWMIAADGSTDKLFFRTGAQTFAMTSAAVPRNTWTHVAISRSGSTVRNFINGALEGSGTFSGSLTNSEPVQIGRSPTADYVSHFNGYLDELRVTKIARYEASFTPQTAAFPDALTLPVTITGSGGVGSALSWSSVPASATASGTAGQIAYDGDFLYVAVGSNQWERAALSTWSPFTPASVTGLQAWYDASDASTLFDATSGGSLVAADGAVARWQDKSGNGRHFTQSSSGSRPLRKTSQQNGLATLLFDGANDLLTGPDIADYLQSGQAETVFVVMKTLSTGERHEILSKQDQAGGWRFLIESDNKATLFFDSNASNRTTVATSSVVSTSAYTLLAWKASGGSLTTSAAIYRNGTTLGTSVSGSVASVPDNSDALVCGASYYQGAAYDTINGNIAEIIIYDAALSDTDRAAVESYLMTKWAIT